MPLGATTQCAALQPHIFDETSRENAARQNAVERLGELAGDAGCSLPQLAVAFTVADPGVTSAMLGLRTLEQLTALLEGAAVQLDDAALREAAGAGRHSDGDRPRPHDPNASTRQRSMAGTG